MMRCDSCFRYFAKVGDLFEHIQSSCLSFYKRHPEAWAQILSQMTSGSTEESTKAITSVQASQEQPDHQNMACSSLDQPASSSLAGPINRNKSIPLKCKCEAQFNSLEDFKAHLKVCTPGKEPPFCIMFSAQQTTNGRPLKNLHMTVNDYFYGSLPGKSVKLKKITRRFNCYSCGKTLRNNIRFMSHVRHKIFNEWEKKEKVDARNICQHCYRQYSSPFQLQGHLENVHGSVPAASTCRICELHFSSEKTFLFHMKDEHLHNEAPYVCKVCCYQSSFYSDVVRHFREVHGDTSALMCPFCLMVSYNSNSFLKHVLQHIKKGFGCAHCRLVFNNSKERTTHKQEDHVSRVMEDKQRKYKNLHKCQVYIRVASFQTSQRQQLMQKAPEKFLEKGLKRLNSADATLDGPSPSKKTISAPSIKLPGYLCPLKRRQPVKSVRLFKNSGFLVPKTKCMECGEGLEWMSSCFVEHFQNSHECRWCVYVTSCEKAASNHILKEHADAELREQLLGKTEDENTSFGAVLDDDDDVEVSDVKVESEQAEALLPISLNGLDVALLDPTTGRKETQSGIDSSNATTPRTSPSASNNAQGKARRKQPNPTKIAGTDAVDSPPSKKMRKEKKNQTRDFEKQRGTQVSDGDFSKTPDVVIVGDSTSETKKKAKRTRPRKILAPEGYFPDIDDDEGWAKYFANVKGTRTKKSATADVSKTALPTMVPRLSTTSIIAAAAAQGSPSPVVPVGNAVGNVALASPAPSKGTQPKVQHRSLSSIAGPAPLPDSPRTNNRSLFRFQLLQPNGLPFTHSVPTRSNVIFPVKTPQNSTKISPKSPVNLRCLEVTHSSMLIQWDPPNNCPVKQYKVIFQGSGAPTVQLLPPEQTLVRLVGLKSDTSYVVRVYALFHKGISQYAFLYQTTNKLPRHTGGTRSTGEVVLVDDDEPNTVSNAPAPFVTTSKPSVTTATPSNLVSLPCVVSTTRLSAPPNILTKTAPLASLVQVQNAQLPVMQTALPTSTAAGLSTGPRDVTGGTTNDEKSQKLLMISDLLAGFKKNKNLRVKVKTKQTKLLSTDDENKDASAEVDTGMKDGENENTNGGELVLDGDFREQKTTTEMVTNVIAGSECASNFPKLVLKAPEVAVSFALNTTADDAVSDVPELTDVPLVTTAPGVKQSEYYLSDKENMPIVEDLNLCRNDDVEVNIVNVVSLSDKSKIEAEGSQEGAQHAAVNEFATTADEKGDVSVKEHAVSNETVVDSAHPKEADVSARPRSPAITADTVPDASDSSTGFVVSVSADCSAKEDSKDEIPATASAVSGGGVDGLQSVNGPCCAVAAADNMEEPVSDVGDAVAESDEQKCAHAVSKTVAAEIPGPVLNAYDTGTENLDGSCDVSEGFNTLNKTESDESDGDRPLYSSSSTTFWVKDIADLGLVEPTLKLVDCLGGENEVGENGAPSAVSVARDVSSTGYENKTGSSGGVLAAVEPPDNDADVSIAVEPKSGGDLGSYKSVDGSSVTTTTASLQADTMTVEVSASVGQGVPTPTNNHSDGENVAVADNSALGGKLNILGEPLTFYDMKDMMDDDTPWL